MFKKLLGWKSETPEEFVVRESFPDELKEALEEWAIERGENLGKLIDRGDDELKWYICKWRYRTRWADPISDDPAFYAPLRMIVIDSHDQVVYDLPPTKKE